MLETLLGISLGEALGIVGGLAFLVSLITQVLKNIVPKKFPTKILVIIISLILTELFVIIFGGITLLNIVFGAIGSFIVGFIAMYGWDNAKELYNRYRYQDVNKNE